jgi:hypothetical protein
VAEQQPGSVEKKNSIGKPVSSGQKIMIHNIYGKFREQNQALSKTEMVKRVSEAPGIGLTLVWQTIKEMEEAHAVNSPPRKRNRMSFYQKLDEAEKKIRQIFHSFFLRRELPTLNKCCSCS